MRVLSACLCGMLLGIGVALGEEPEVKPPPSARQKSLEQFTARAAQYRILRRGEAVPLTLHSPAVLSWGNPARTGEEGALFVWMHEGHPEVLGSVFTYRIGKMVYEKHELHSLSPVPLTASLDGQPAWAPDRAGVAFQTLPDPSVAADTPARRLLQMRSIARQYSATLTNPRHERHTLRLMPQPVIRYQPRSGSVVDGALFAYSLGTDPEVLLMLEAVRSSAGLQWKYAFVRNHYWDIRVTRNDVEVFRAPLEQPLESNVMGGAAYLHAPYSTYRPLTPTLDVQLPE